MQRYLQNHKTFSLLVLFILISLISKAQPTITGAKISDNRSNYLEVTFSENISVSNADGFRLTGGSARIKSLLGGSGSSQLIFSLTDNVLPDDIFKLLYWQELSDAVGSSGRLSSVTNYKVDNQAKTYHGSGKIYYISSSGNDSNDGLSASKAKKSLQKTLSLATAGDYVLLKRGDSWEEVQQLAFSQNGTSTKYITLAAYGSGNKPLLVGSLSDEAILVNKNFVQVDNIHVKAKDNLYGILFSNNAKNAVLSNSKVEAVDRTPNSGRTDHAIYYGTSGVENPIILNNEVSGARWGISSSGYPYTESNGVPSHQVKGGIVENNVILNTATSDFSGNDGIQIARGDYHGIIIRKNTITQWSDDGIDTYLGFNITIEYNTLYSPRSGAANAIKCGGVARGGSELPVGRKSEGLVVRYNTVHDVNLKNTNHAINTNDGGQAEIYGNLAYNISGSGCQVSGDIVNYKIYNNTFINCNYGISCYTDGNNAGEIYIYNNIVEGSANDINGNTRSSGQSMKGENNILLTGKVGGSYQGKNDKTAKKASLFLNASNHDYQLNESAIAKDSGKKMEGYTIDRIGNLIDASVDIGAYEFNDGESIQIPESPESPEPEPSPSPEPEVPVDDLASGLNYKYYEGSWSNVPDFEKLDAIKTGNIANFSLAPRESNDHFGFLYSGYIKVENTGSYTFYTNSDDGSLLYIDGTKVVDNNGTHGPRERSGSVSLSAGYHAIEVGFFENISGQVLEVRYSGPGVSKKLIPSNVLYREVEDNASPSPEPEDPSDELANGLNYEYYEGSWSNVPNFNNLQPKKTGTVSNFSLNPREKNDKFAFLYKGYIKINQAGTYNFYTNSDDGSLLYINGAKIVDNNGTHGPRERSGSIQLAVGFYELEVGFFENVSGQVLEVKYSGPGISKTLIPSNVLYRESESTSSPTPEEPTLSSGLNYRYYEDSNKEWIQLPVFENLSAVKTGTTKNFSLDPRLIDDYFGFVFEGLIEIKTRGEYTFYTDSDDGSKLYINDALVVDNDGLRPAVEIGGKVTLDVGVHKILVSYFEGYGGESLAVRYQGPGISKQLIPDQVLFNDNNLRLASNSKGSNLQSELETTSIETEIFTKTPSILVYPNPVQSQFILSTGTSLDNAKVSLYDLSGQMVFEKQIPSLVDKVDIDINSYNLPKGKYILLLYADDKLIDKTSLLKR